MNKSIAGILPVFLLLFVFGRAAGQEASLQKRADIVISGVVIDSQTEAFLPNVHYSVSGRTAGMTDRAGQFALFAGMNDSIHFSMVGYKSALLVIGSEFTASQYLVMVAMVTDTLQIAEVVVMPRLDALRTIASGSSQYDSRELNNARGNLNLSFHQGLTGANQTGDPAINYEMVRRKLMVEAYEKGGIPSDRIASISPIMAIPALYLLMNGLPETPSAPAQGISNRDLERLKSMLRDQIYNRKLPFEKDSLDNMACHFRVLLEPSR